MDFTINIPAPTSGEWLAMRRKMHADEPTRSHRLACARWLREARRTDRARTRIAWKLLLANMQRLIDDTASKDPRGLARYLSPPPR